MPVYPAYVEVSTPQLRLLTQLLREQRRGLGGRPRALTAGRQALLVLARLRNNDTYTRLAKGFGIGLATAHRYVTEAVGLLAAKAPTLEEALKTASRKAFVTLDGTLVPMDRIRARPRGNDRDYFSGKIGSHAMNVQVIAGPLGEVIWASAALPGAQHDITAARAHDLPHTLKTLKDAGVRVLADKGYQGGGPAISVPLRSRRKNPDTGTYLPLSANVKAVNASHARLRAVGERANAQLKSWAILTHLRDSPERATPIVRAIVALIHKK